MNKKQFIERMVEHTDSPKGEARKHLEAFTTGITEALKSERKSSCWLREISTSGSRRRGRSEPADRREDADRGQEGSGIQGGQGPQGVHLVSAKASRWHRPDVGV